eukprot:XP_016660960.1 PREDICTED: UDP-glucuronosyltransferase 2B37 [Acyrthosiphon pisum]
MKDKPKNVMTRKWFPQRDILLHPKVKLFISHGGMSGVYEAVDGGVPVLGFPVIYDQPRNIENLVLNGMAISMDLLSTTKENLSYAISELINDEKYAKNAKIGILDFIENSTQGVIFFTFGSTIKVSSLPGHIEQSFKEVLANIPQRVLWKYEGEMKDKPKNVMTRKWFPQRDIYCTKLWMAVFPYWDFQ